MLVLISLTPFVQPAVLFKISVLSVGIHASPDNIPYMKYIELVIKFLSLLEYYREELIRTLGFFLELLISLNHHESCICSKYTKLIRMSGYSRMSKNPE